MLALLFLTPAYLIGYIAQLRAASTKPIVTRIAVRMMPKLRQPPDVFWQRYHFDGADFLGV